MRRALFSFLAAFLLASPGLAQTVQQAGPWTQGHAPSYSIGGGSQPFVTDGGPASGSGANNPLREGLYVAPAPAGGGLPPYSASGTGPNGANWCDYDAPPSSGSFHFLCLSPNAAGFGLIAYGATGAALPQHLVFSINGTIFDPLTVVNPTGGVNVLTLGVQITAPGGYEAAVVDPAGTFDNTAALNAACATGLPLYFPTGRYHIKDTWHCNKSLIFGDGQENSVIDIGTDFNMSAVAAFDLIDTNAGQNATHVMRMGFQQYQNPNISYGSIADLIHYPPVMTATHNGRATLEDVELGRCYDGIVTTINTLINMKGMIQLGCFNHPIHMDGNADWTFWDNVEVWDFGLNNLTNFTTLWNLGASTVELGHIDGLMVNSFGLFHAGIHILSSAVNGVGFNISKLQFDNGNGIVMDAGHLAIGQLLSDNNFPLLSMGGVFDSTQVDIDYCRCNAGTVVNYIANHGGQLVINGGLFNWLVTGGPIFQVDDATSASRTVLNNIVVHGLSGVAPSATVFSESGANVGLVISGFRALNSPAPSVPVISAVDVAQNNFQNISWGAVHNLPISLAISGAVKGYYDLPNFPFAITATPQFATNGDFVPANVATVGNYKLRGDHVDFALQETFDTNGFTTAAGGFSLLTNLPVAVGPGLNVPVVLGGVSKVTVGADFNLAAELNYTNPTTLFPIQNKSTLSWSNLGTGNVVPSTSGVIFRMSGSYPIL